MTDLQNAERREKGNTIQWDVDDWADVRAVYIPAAVAAEQADLECRKTSAKMLDMKLWLPSQLTPTQRQMCLRDVPDIEYRYRLAQAKTALTSIRSTLRLRLRLWTVFRHQVSGDGGRYSTRSRSLINRVQLRVKRNTVIYQAAYDALSSLMPDLSWQQQHQLFHLRDQDVRGPSYESDAVDDEIRKLRIHRKSARLGIATDSATDRPATLATRGTYDPSWIWKVRVVDADGKSLAAKHNAEYHDQARAEWAQSHTRAERWQEEIAIVAAEMQRMFLALCSRWTTWTARAERASLCADVEHAGGLRVYAYEQADVARTLAHHCAASWHAVLSIQGLPDWWKSTTAWIVEADTAVIQPLIDIESPTSPASSTHSWAAMTASKLRDPPQPRKSRLLARLLKKLAPQVPYTGISPLRADLVDVTLDDEGWEDNDLDIPEAAESDDGSNDGQDVDELI